ncbi:MAG: phosphotransacetylase family protein [Elusimicrobiota bacterium]|nr:phosphotransacetylase family protein [Elusimicrobiota bacterium]
MVSLYVGSTCEYSGKTLVCIGLGKRFQSDGISVAYFKPLGKLPVRVGKLLADEDAVSMQEILGLQDPLDLVCPVVLTQDLTIQAYTKKIKSLENKVIEAYGKISRGRDLVLIGGGSNFNEGSFLGIPARKLIREMKAKAILIDKCETDILVDPILAASEFLGESLVGVVLNRVALGKIEYFKRRIVPFLKRQGIEVLGMIPQDTLLNAISIGELSDNLGGEILCCDDKVDEMVEHFMIGAMNVEGALRYFRKVQNKAVITGGDRADIQLAALETSTRCIILTGNLFPSNIIISRAEERQVPMVLVKEDTLTTVEKIESLLRRLRVSGKKKVARAVELVNREVNFRSLYDKLGIRIR